MRAPEPQATLPAAGLDLHDEIAQLAQQGGADLQCRSACTVTSGARRFDVPVLTLGNADPQAAAVGFFGGVHGLERIGAEVVMAQLRNVVQRLRWDAALRQMLTGLRLVFMPLVNPGGHWRGTRANPRGVDLMRNAPVDCVDGAPFLLGGQRLGRHLPWFRGEAGAPMEAEAEALCEVVRTELLSHDFALSIDCHSGFGLADRLWFPFAHTRRPVEHLPELHALSELLDEALVHHRYLFEPQSRQYLTHGDLWDHLYLQSLQGGARVFLPLTLEMGSWLWVKKNPRQLFSRRGMFNPLLEHRRQRVVRRHMALMDCAMRAAFSHRHWLPALAAREPRRSQALDQWYAPRPQR